MIELLKIILSLSFSGTILILLLFVCRPVYRNRMSKRWQYYIWLLVIARLLLPITPERSLTGNLFKQAEQLTEQSGYYSSAYSDINDDAGIELNAEDSAAYISSNNNVNIEPNAEASSTEKAARTNSTDNRVSMAGQTLCILWLFAALLLFVRKITVYQSFVKYVTAGSKPVDDITLLERFGRIMAENHINGTVELCVNDLVSSPLLIGFTRARVVLPTIDLSEDDFYYTVLHELIHYKRRDMFYKWLVQLTICLHWFNPFVYLMGHEINRVCELSCDERVITTLSDKSRKLYGDTLLNAISTGGSYKDTLASVTLNESKELLKGRLDAIMKYKKIPKAVQTAAVFITGILIGGAAVLGAYAAHDTETTHNASSSFDNRSSSDSIDTAMQDTNNTTRTTDYTIQYEDGTFYILTDGTTEADKPVSAVTNGYYHLVLVRKDEYHSFGSWKNREMQQLVRHITTQCRTALENGRMTQEDADIVIAASTEIQETFRSGDDIEETYRSGSNDSVTDDSGNGNSVTLYNYTQAAYYQAPYIIEIGYNLTVEAQSKYTGTLITLSDQSTMPVFFSAKSEKNISDTTAMSAVTALIERMVPQTAKSASRPLEAPFIVSMEYVGETNMDSLAEKYYGEEMLTYFGAIFLELDTEAQQKYLDRMFEDGNISYFACCIGMFKRTDMQSTPRQKDIVDHYILKAYEEGKVNFFAVLSGELDEETRKSWLERCKKDGRADYYYILADEDEDIFDDTDFMDDDDYFDEWNELQNADSYAPNILDLNRITKQDVSTNLRNVLDSCDSGKWYVITENNCQYIYYSGLPHTYAYEPHIDGSEEGDLITVAIMDIGVDSALLRRRESVSDYVLLMFAYSPAALSKNYNLAITYNKAPITYESMTTE